MTKKNYINTIKNIDPWVAENTFYLKATPERISKFMSHYEIFNKIKNLKGDVVECGVFRGASLSRFMNFDKIFKSNKKFYAFDAFGKFPDSGTKEDKTFSKKHNKLGYGIKKKKKICLLHLDLDVYEATKHVLKNLFPLIVKNGIILIDDYSHISNTTKAINNFLKVKKKLKIKKFTFPCRPSYIIKDF